MAKRGRSSKTKTKTSKKSSVGSFSIPASIKAKGMKAVQAFMPGKTSKKQAREAMGFGKKKSAKSLLKKAYEKKARIQIRMGMLGTARRTLRKKATVV